MTLSHFDRDPELEREENERKERTTLNRTSSEIGARIHYDFAMLLKVDLAMAESLSISLGFEVQDARDALLPKCLRTGCGHVEIDHYNGRCREWSKTSEDSNKPCSCEGFTVMDARD